MCRLLEVSSSGYYGWVDRPASRRITQDNALLQRVRLVHSKSRMSYGYVKTWKELNSQGVRCGKHRIARIRKTNGIEPKRVKRFKITTKSKCTKWNAPNRLNRQFTSPKPNATWVGDVTFISTKRGWLYLAVLLDLYSRKVIGWSMSNYNNKTLTLNALKMAIHNRKPKAGVIHHTDRGSSYTTDDYQHLLRKNGIIPSMSRKGDCYDNAVAESFFSTLKNELVHDQKFECQDHARSEIFKYIEVFYNRQRIHQSIGWVAPEVKEMMFN